MNQHVQKSLLKEQLEWLVKMGFTIEDIMEWAQNKKRLGEDDTLNSSSNNNNITLSTNSESPQQPNSDNTLLTSSALTHTSTDRSRLQEILSIPAPPSPPPLPPHTLDLSLSTPVDRGEAQTPSKREYESRKTEYFRVIFLPCCHPGGRRNALTNTRSRKRANSNTNQGKQPRVKRGRLSKGMLCYGMVWYGMVWYGEDLCNYRCFCDHWLHATSGRRVGEVPLRSPTRLSVEKSRKRAMTVLKDEMMQGGYH